jgi:addiction module RelE/StbE family toxin
MAEIVWTEEALSDLEAIGAYFERTSPQYASAVVGRLYSSVEQLVEYPKIGRKVPEIDHESLRELIVEDYRIVYQLQEERIEIVTVLHSRQDIERKFRERGE